MATHDYEPTPQNESIDNSDDDSNASLSRAARGSDPSLSEQHNFISQQQTTAPKPPPLATDGSLELTQARHNTAAACSQGTAKLASIDPTLPSSTQEYDTSMSVDARAQVNFWQVVWDWKWQTLSLFLSVSSFICLVTVVLVYAERPLTDWASSTISINAVIAGLATVMKGSLIFPVADVISQNKWRYFTESKRSAGGAPLLDIENIDHASRGPWGSALWIARGPLRDPSTTLCASLIVVGVAFNLFTQQIVDIELRSVPDENTVASIPWVQQISKVPFGGSERGSAQWTAALMNGFMSESIPDLMPSCPSRNCTWDTVPTLGFCGECVERQPVKRVCWDNPMPDMSETYRWGEQNRNATTYSMCNYANSYDHQVMNSTYPPEILGYELLGLQQDRTSNGPSAWLGDANVKAFLDAMRFPNDSYPDSYNPASQTLVGGHWVNGTGLFSIFEILRLNTPHLGQNVTGKQFPNTIYSFEPQSSICGLWYCLQAIDARVSDGQLNQSVKDGPPTRFKQGDSVDTVPGFNMDGLSFSTGGVLQSGLYSMGNQAPPQTRDVITMMNPLFRVATLKTLEDDKKVIKNMARSLTNELRVQNSVRATEGIPEDAPDPRSGTVWVERTFITARWAWVAYPAALLAAAIALFVASVWETCTHRRRVWLDSVLVPLIVSLDDDLRQQIQGGDLDSAQRLAAAVKGRRVFLEKDGEKWVMRDRG